MKKRANYQVSGMSRASLRLFHTAREAADHAIKLWKHPRVSLVDVNCSESAGNYGNPDKPFDRTKSKLVQVEKFLKDAGLTPTWTDCGNACDCLMLRLYDEHKNMQISEGKTA